MKTLVVYSSLTGNTQKVAEAIFDILPEGKKLAKVEENPDCSEFDLICLGYWVDKGAPDAKMKRYMEHIKGKMIGLFGTLGAYPDSDHAKDCLQKAAELMAGNELLGSFICQGKVDPKLLAAMAKMTEASKAHPMTPERAARIEEAKKHPNAEDFAQAKACFKQIVAKAQATKA